MALYYRALRADIEENLLPLSAVLQERGVRHRVIEDGGQQVLEVDNQEDVEIVRELYAAWRRGDVQIELKRRARASTKGLPRASFRPVRAPVTLTLIALSVVGFMIVTVPALQILESLFSSLPYRVEGEQLVVSSMGREYWRLITPVFLHFGLLHIVFNCLWLWDLGPRVEVVVGRFNMVMLFLVIALVSNMCQSFFTEFGLFGGLSGVVYGLLGFTWVGPLLQPAWRIQPTRSIMLFMVGWLVICSLGLVEAVGFGKIANAAHWGGLFCGLALGVIFGLMSRLGGDKQGDASL